MKFILNQYRSAFVFYNAQLKKWFVGYLILFFVACGIGIALDAYPPVHEYYNKILQSFINKVETETGPAIFAPGSDAQFAANLFFNNGRANTILTFVGVVPLLPLFVILLNAITMVSVVIHVVSNSSITGVRLVAFGIMPHGILEIPAIILSAALGTRLFLDTTSWIWNWFRKRESHLFYPSFANICRCFFIVVLPLTLVAALIEAYITPILLDIAYLI